MATRYPKHGNWTELELKTIQPEWRGDTLRDGDGLVGEVRANNDGISIQWRWEFKWLGKKARHFCGIWPASTMRAIRKERDTAKTVRDSGVHPSFQRQVERIEAQAKVEATIAEAERKKAEDAPFRDMFEVWMRDGVKREDGNAELRRTFEKDVLPSIGDKPVRSITDTHLLEVLRQVGRVRGAGRTAERMASEVRQLYRWAIKRQPWRGQLRDGNPAELVDTVQVVPDGYESEPRERVLSPDELRELRSKLADMKEAYANAPAGKKYEVARPLKEETQLALWISLGTACRIGELLKSRWEHVNIETGVWIVPRQNTKTKVEWTVFLSPFALRHFKMLHTLTGDSDWCFPARRMGREREGAQPAATHVCEKSVSKQVGDRQLQFMARKGPLTHRQQSNVLVLAGGKNGEWTPHDLRRTAATMMQSLGVLPDIIDRCQNHKLPGDDRGRKLAKVRKHYQHYDYAREKREAWDKLSERLDLILNNANVD